MKTTLMEELQFARHLLAFAKRPDELDHLRKLGNVAANLRDNSAGVALLALAMEDHGFLSLYKQEYYAEAPDLDSLLELPPDSLGYAFATHIRENNLDVEFVGATRSKHPGTQFLAERVRRTHDIVHVLTGFGADKPSEMGVQAFCVAQLPSGIHAAIIAGGLLHALREDLSLIEPVFEAIERGLFLGKRSRFVLGVNWEERWAEPLDQVRAQMGIDLGFAEAA